MINRENIIDYEKSILGGILVYENSIESVMRLIESSDFEVAKHRIIYTALMKLYSEAAPIDLLSLSDELNSSKVMDSSGGYGYIAELTSNPARPESMKYYLRRIKSYSRKNQLSRLSVQVKSDLEDGSNEADVVNLMEQSIVDIMDESENRSYTTYLSAMINAMKKVEAVIEHGDAVFKAKTGIKSIDNLIGGLEGGDYMIIGARPSVGKSAIALQIALDVAEKQSKKCGFFTAEMSDSSIATRAASQHLKIDSKKLKMGQITQAERMKIADYGANLGSIPLFINDTPNIRFSKLRSQARLMKRREEIDIIIVDYIGLLRGDQRLPRWEMFTNISASLKQLARDLDVPIIVLSQLGRATDSKRPSLADLRETGAIEQDADIIMFLHRPNPPETDQFGASLPVPIELIMAKNRNGPIGTSKVHFIPQYTRFEEIAYEQEPERWYSQYKD